jgi:hypothetical protein
MTRRAGAKRTLRRVAIGFGTALVALLVLGALLPPVPTDPKTHKSQTPAQVQRALGQPTHEVQGSASDAADQLNQGTKSVALPAPKPQPKPVKPAAQEKPAAEEGPEMTSGQENAVESAQSYIDMGGFSRQGLIEQLSSSAGEGFTLAQAQYAVSKVY